VSGAEKNKESSGGGGLEPIGGPFSTRSAHRESQARPVLFGRTRERATRCR
jgi:hypothetical protein